MMIPIYKTGFILAFLLLSCTKDPGKPVALSRNDNAVRLNFSAGGASCQNPAFSLEGSRILFTRFLSGYNRGPSELVVLDVPSRALKVVMQSSEADNVNVPGFSWVDGRICWSSDSGGGSDELFIAREDGTGIRQITRHPEKEEVFIEPVFNPVDTNKIVFESGSYDIRPHHIMVVESDKGNRLTRLTDNSEFDDRLPGWTPTESSSVSNGRIGCGTIRRIVTALMDFSGDAPCLRNPAFLNQPESHNTDNSWFADGRGSSCPPGTAVG